MIPKNKIKEKIWLIGAFISTFIALFTYYTIISINKHSHLSSNKKQKKKDIERNSNKNEI